MDENSKDPKRPDRIVRQARELADFCGKKQIEYSQIAQDFGYSREVFHMVASNFEGIPDDPIFASTESSISNFNALLHNREEHVNTSFFNVASSSYAIGSSAASTAIVVSFGEVGSIKQHRKSIEPPPRSSSNPVNEYAELLSKLDPELGKLLRSTWQSFYGGAENAERASLLSMRQLYDHLFSKLAPDDEVRNSSFFTRKNGDKPDQVHRKERIYYAADKWVKRVELREMLRGQADHILKVYDRLNILHKRQSLCSEPTKEVLIAMQAVIEQWIKAINI